MYTEKLSGVFAPVVTPFDDDKVRYDWLAENIEKLGESRLKGYFVLGSNGEFASLSEEEQLSVLKTISQHKGNKILMAGASREATKQTLEFAKRAIEIGVDFISLLTPHYFAKRMTDDVLIRYFTEVADNLDVPVVLYNAPTFAAQVEISPRALKAMASHPNIVGIKNSSVSSMNAYLWATREMDDFSVLAGSADFFYTALVCGAKGGVLSIANFLPDLCVDLYEAAIEGRWEQAKQLHFKLFTLNRAVSGAGGVGAVKAAMDMLGFHGGAPRRPLVSLDENLRREMEKVFREEGII